MRFHYIISIAHSFQAFFANVFHIRTRDIVFEDFYSKATVTAKTPRLVDPTNPYNNLLAGGDFTELEKAANATYQKLTQGCRDLTDIFFPQPLINTLIKDKWIQPK